MKGYEKLTLNFLVQEFTRNPKLFPSELFLFILNDQPSIIGRIQCSFSWFGKYFKYISKINIFSEINISVQHWLSYFKTMNMNSTYGKCLRFLANYYKHRCFIAKYLMLNRMEWCVLNCSASMTN